MILNTPENRRLLLAYLANVVEDEFIEDFIKPFLSGEGYYLFRVNSHGPSEHGKDLIFYRHIPFFYDFEYIAVQAKAESVTTANVQKFADQLKRAYNTAFPLRTEGRRANPHYVLMINARRHTNEAEEELNDILKDYRHIKILSQDAVCEMIMRTGIVCEKVKIGLHISVTDKDTPEDREVYGVLMRNVSCEVKDLFTHRLGLVERHLSGKTKQIVIEFIYQRWMQDRSWSGTVQPMEWLNRYFSFMTRDQYPYLMDVIEEFASDYPSYEARGSVSSVFNHTTAEMISTFSEKFIGFCADIALSHKDKNRAQVMSKLEELLKSGLVTNPTLIRISETTLRVESERRAENRDSLRIILPELMKLRHPDWI
jgi:hypothetical protein